MSRDILAAPHRSGGRCVLSFSRHPDPRVNDAEKRNQRKLSFPTRAILESVLKFKRGVGGGQSRADIQILVSTMFVDEKWRGDPTRVTSFFVHAKVLLIDPLSDDRWLLGGRRIFEELG